jgi:hypothetical protein
MTYDPSTDPDLVADLDLAFEKPCSGSLIEPTKNQLMWARLNLDRVLALSDGSKSDAEVVDAFTITVLAARLRNARAGGRAEEIAQGGLATIAVRNEWHAANGSTP